MEITARIVRGIQYTPLLCRTLKHYKFSALPSAFNDATFFLDMDSQNKLAVSWWVSAKRTRSYPYARVYDSFGFTGKKLTIIPIVKDEGIEGDRDFLQWDTVSLMSLLGVYVIIAYYKDAVKSTRYDGKITEQTFDMDYIKAEIGKLTKYQSDALHWNIDQISKINMIGNKAIEAYDAISKKLGVKTHSRKSAERKINELMKDKDAFLASSRLLAKNAQMRESHYTHLAEKVLAGAKASLTISNYLGGYYYFTADEARVDGSSVYLVEAKNTGGDKQLPSLGDIKDGLLKMILFTNLEEVTIGKKLYTSIPVLKLTGSSIVKEDARARELLDILKKEASTNGFKVEVNSKFII
ncbi:MAG: hypothetical protein BK997_03815 [Candidatus Micrarchaeum sp. ARMAN-1]|jgi:hypothetical protein|nr:MAG: hypothetical protein BK997_03815 [Candidatus Micrarchaeum sp. ARMAN-1]